MSLGSATEGQAGEQGTGDLETTAFVLGSGETEAQRGPGTPPGPTVSLSGVGPLNPSFDGALAQHHPRLLIPLPFSQHLPWPSSTGV